MKLLLQLLGSLLAGLTALTALAEPPGAGALAQPGTATLTAVASARKSPGKAAGKSGAEEEPPKIEGITIPRSNGGFLGIQIVNANFKLSFYDDKKKPLEPDVVRAVLRWDPKYKVGQERIVLNMAGDGKSLTNSRSIRPPYNFKLFMSLFKDAAAEAGPAESHVIDFRQ